jgi:hypothetical protein
MAKLPADLVLHRLRIIAVAALLFLWEGTALAQSSAGEPGPRSLAHKGLGSFPVVCNKCHDAGQGVPNEKCLGCHTHQPLRDRIQANKGFHATQEVKSKPCKECHAEHIEEPAGSGKGRRTTIDWKPYNGKRNFNHRLTGWPLDGQHRTQECEKCHDKKYPETKLPTYLGLREECTTCHHGTKKDKGVGGYNPHQFTDVTLTDCKLCHNFNSFAVANLGATKWDHDKTAFPLVGFHQRNKCIECHKDNIETFKVKREFGTAAAPECKACHEDSHKSVISASRKCSQCHSFKVNFKKTRFDHGKETKFPLKGKHQENKCAECHKVNSPPEKPKMECIGCHGEKSTISKTKDPHKERFGKEPCEGCHSEVGFKTAIHFDHDKKTKFELSGKHEKAKCTDCHRGGIAQGYERHKSTECADCHQHQKAHCGQFGLKNCERCHVRGGDRTSKFDHNLTKFPLERAHAKVDCDRCHKPQKLGETDQCRNAVKYTGLEPACFGCHTDIHQGELGKDCAKCHTGGENFKTLVFDHNRDSRFSLTGFHQLVTCDECHPQRKYKLEKMQCNGCHAKDDVHDKKLGDDCAKCHETTGGAPKFDHNVHTGFPQEGVHARIECERCHFLILDKSGNKKPIEGETKQKILAGADSSKEMTATAKPGAPLDLLFRSAGKDCDICHPDPHQVREGLACNSCHGFEKWTAPPRNDYHESAGFSLTGAHTIVACSMCHTGAGSMRGRGQRCGTCHGQDDIHAGSFGSECGSCHMQDGWIPTTFTHMDTGFVLEGLHRTLECRQCHLAGNYFIGKNPQCYNCHLSDYLASAWHKGQDLLLNSDPRVGLPDKYVITGLGGAAGAVALMNQKSFDCDGCHTQFTFAGAVTNTVPP